MAEEKKSGREEELVEAAFAAAAAALFVSGVKKFMPMLVAQWPVGLLAATPSPVLFLLLNIIIASIVVVSVRPKSVSVSKSKPQCEKMKKKRKRRESSRSVEIVSDSTSLVEKINGAEPGEEEAAGNAEELNKRVEEFISAFRHQLRVDSFSSGARRGNARECAIV